MNHPPSVSLSKMVLRLSVTILSFFASGVCLLPFVLIFPWFVGAFPTKGLDATLIMLVWGHAVTAYLAMSIGWVANWRIARFWPLSGTATGVLSLLAIPVYAIIKRPESSSYSATDLVIPLLAETIFLFPNIVLAVVLVRFHLRPQEADNGCIGVPSNSR